jgi:putative transcriptional regulator
MPQKHSIDLTGKLLLAMPAMADPRFIKAVILVCAHDDNGAMGVMINQPLMGLTLNQLLKQLKVIGEEDSFTGTDTAVLSGGPVENARGFLIHTSDFKTDETIVLNNRFGVSSTLEALHSYGKGNGPKEALFALGYAGWSAGQLEAELAENAWMVMEADHEVLFNTPHPDKWERALGRMGISPIALSSQSGRA